MLSKHLARRLLVDSRDGESTPPGVTVALRPSVSVLIVDDDSSYVEFIRHVFSQTRTLRFELKHVSRLADILPALEPGGISVVLLDINLPDGNGLRWLDANRSRLQAAVIVLTGVSEFDAEDLAPGAQDFLLKDQVDPHQLVRAVRYAADRERARQQLVRSREYFQSLIEQASDLITVVDERGVILYQSPSSNRVLGQAPEALLNRSLFDLMVDTDTARARACLDAAFAGAEGTSCGEFDLRHSSGSIRSLDIIASKISSGGGSPQVVLNSRDITERRLAAEALRLSDEQLIQSQKMEAVGRLAGGIAHDFSNVLTVITGASERLIERVGKTPELLADLESILRNCDRAASLTRQLLAFSRQQTLAPQPLDLSHLVETAGSLLKRLIGEDIDLAFDLPPDVQAVEADPTQLEQVLMNLAINARDAMPEGGSLRISVRPVTIGEEFARRHAPMCPGAFVLLQVSDTGQGMTSETQARAFEPFFTTKHSAHGTGLGLSTVYGIIKQSGGFVWIDSLAGRGTTFSIYLPPTAARPLPAIPPQKTSRGPMRPATILLAEDESEVRGLLRDLLESHGHTVLDADGPVNALLASAAFDGRIDLLLTDVVMPGGTGRDLARALIATRPGIKVLYISGYPEYGASPKRVLEPGLPFLSKPFTRDLLLAKLTELLG